MSQQLWPPTFQQNHLVQHQCFQQDWLNSLEMNIEMKRANSHMQIEMSYGSVIQEARKTSNCACLFLLSSHSLSTSWPSTQQHKCQENYSGEANCVQDATSVSNDETCFISQEMKCTLGISPVRQTEELRPQTPPPQLPLPAPTWITFEPKPKDLSNSRASTTDSQESVKNKDRPEQSKIASSPSSIRQKPSSQQRLKNSVQILEPTPSLISSSDEQMITLLPDSPLEKKQSGAFCMVPSCPVLLDTLEKFHAHLNTYHTINTLKCPVSSCRFRFDTWRPMQIKKHDYKFHSNMTTPHWTCTKPNCSAVGYSFISRVHHDFDFHTPGMWFCRNKHCYFYCRLRYERIAHEEKCCNLKIVCPRCGVRFMLESSLRDHLQMDHKRKRS